MHAPTIAAIHKNQTLNALAIGITIIVGGFTIYYLVHQTKLLKLQIDKHEAEQNKLTNEKSPK
jgi:hypothetical protein